MSARFRQGGKEKSRNSQGAAESPAAAASTLPSRKSGSAPALAREQVRVATAAAAAAASHQNTLRELLIELPLLQVKPKIDFMPRVLLRSAIQGQPEETSLLWGKGARAWERRMPRHLATYRLLPEPRKVPLLLQRVAAGRSRPLAPWTWPSRRGNRRRERPVETGQGPAPLGGSCRDTIITCTCA